MLPNILTAVLLLAVASATWGALRLLRQLFPQQPRVRPVTLALVFSEPLGADRRGNERRHRQRRRASASLAHAAGKRVAR